MDFHHAGTVEFNMLKNPFCAKNSFFLYLQIDNNIIIITKCKEWKFLIFIQAGKVIHIHF
ncbi:MAG: hypothetical protein A2096_15935 [Spirochaetes bacterium GWF1_41_5]|nr:MAG: hypothetical protein A2096_15935 [Spirochaetes bacterium GWF1_41_5]